MSMNYKMSKNFYKFRYLLAIILLTFINLYAENPTGYILRFPIGAKAVSVACAFVSISDSLNSVPYNPAGLNLTKNEFMTTYNKGLDDIYTVYLSYGRKFLFGDFALSLFYFDGGDIELNYPDRPSETKKAQQDYILFLTYKRNLLLVKNFGINFKIYHSQLVEEVKSLSFVIDAGILRDLYLLNRKINFGLSVRNLSTKVVYSGGLASAEVYEWLPITTVCGCSTVFDFKKVRFLPMIDFVFNVVESKLDTLFGAEFNYQNLFIRSGYNSGTDSVSFGFGINFAKYKLDYATSITPIGFTHYLTLVFKL